MKIGERTCKTIMGKSGIGSVDYSVNPYLGCGHGCVYCYARFMGRWGGHAHEEWGSYVDVKVNALERLEVEAAKKAKGVVLLSSVTDPYQPVERKYELTRGSLKILLEHQFPVSVLTKSDLVLRDIDLLGQFDSCDVGFTITAYDDGVRRVFEPGAAPVEARLDALKKVSDEGIKTWAFLGPILPYLSEEGLDDLLDELASCVNHVLVDRLNIKSGNMPQIRRALSEGYPDLQPLFEAAVGKESGYYAKFKREISERCRVRGIPCDIIF